MLLGAQPVCVKLERTESGASDGIQFVAWRDFTARFRRHVRDLMEGFRYIWSGWRFPPVPDKLVGGAALRVQLNVERK
jgi:hypothetical protein